MKVIALLVAEKIIIDQRTGDVSAVGLIEVVASLTFPHLISDPYVMVAFHREDEDEDESEGELVFLMDEEEIARSSFVVEFGDRPRARTVMQLNGIVVPKAGHLKVCITVGGKRQGEWDILAIKLVETDDRQEVSTGEVGRDVAAQEPGG